MLDAATLAPVQKIAQALGVRLHRLGVFEEGFLGKKLSLNSIAISTTGDFAVSATICTTSLVAKGKCTIQVTFAPTAKGKRTGQLDVNDSASNNPQTASLNGTGD
jgi:hypothetical protein